MTPKTALKFSIKLFLTIAVPSMLTIISIRFVMSYQFLQFEYLRDDFPVDTYGFTADDRLEYAPYAIDYLLNGEDIDFLGDLRLPTDKCWRPAPNATDCPMYESDALRHMVDVKVVTVITFQIGVLLVAITLFVIGLTIRAPQYRFALRRGLTYGSMLTLSLIFTIVVLAMTAWDFFFDSFHQLFFEEGTWRFAFSDTLIRLFPERFWFDASIAIGLLTSIGAILILVLMWQWAKHNT